MFAGIETGGTKTVCAVGLDGVIEDRVQFPTGDDPQALAELCGRFLAPHHPTVLGIGAFGPCDTDPASETYGHILNTPKPGWRNVDLLALLTAQLRVPVSITTDVNAAALGEWHHGSGGRTLDLVYLTIGTGVGGGAVLDGHLLGATRPPEMGHLLLPASDGYGPGVCPYHGNCLEGLVSGPALTARLGRDPRDLTDEDPIWDEIAQIVAEGLHDLTCTLRPQVFVIGGGVGSREGLHRRLTGRLESSLAGYLPAPRIRTPALGSDAGVLGAITLAQLYSQG